MCPEVIAKGIAVKYWKSLKEWPNINLLLAANKSLQGSGGFEKTIVKITKNKERVHCRWNKDTA